MCDSHNCDQDMDELKQYTISTIHNIHNWARISIGLILAGHEWSLQYLSQLSCKMPQHTTTGPEPARCEQHRAGSGPVIALLYGNVHKNQTRPDLIHCTQNHKGGTEVHNPQGSPLKARVSHIIVSVLIVCLQATDHIKALIPPGQAVHKTIISVIKIYQLVVYWWGTHRSSNRNSAKKLIQKCTKLSKNLCLDQAFILKQWHNFLTYWHNIVFQKLFT